MNNGCGFMEQIQTPHLTGTHVALATSTSLPRTNVSSREMIRQNVSTMTPTAHRMRRVRVRGNKKRKQSQSRQTAEQPVVPGGRRAGPVVSSAVSRRQGPMNHLSEMKTELQALPPPDPEHHFWMGSSRERRVMSRRSKIKQQHEEEQEEMVSDASYHDEQKLLQILGRYRRAYEDRRIRNVEHSGEVMSTTDRGSSMEADYRLNTDSIKMSHQKKRSEAQSFFTSMLVGLALIAVVVFILHR